MILCEPTIDAREAATAEVQAATGAVFIPPYNAKNTIAGQGTIALELLEQASRVLGTRTWLQNPIASRVIHLLSKLTVSSANAP